MKAESSNIFWKLEVDISRLQMALVRSGGKILENMQIRPKKYEDHLWQGYRWHMSKTFVLGDSSPWNSFPNRLLFNSFENKLCLLGVSSEKCIELGTIKGPGEDKNRNLTSMSETHKKFGGGT